MASEPPLRPNQSYTERYRRARGDEPAKRRGSASHDRLKRTIIWGSVALLVALFWMVYELGVDAAEVMSFLGASLAFVLGFVVLGVAVGAAFIGVRWLVSGRYRSGDK